MTRSLLHTCVIVACATLARAAEPAPPATLLTKPGKLVFQDDLDHQPDKQAWRYGPGSWTVADGTLKGVERAEDKHGAVLRHAMTFRDAIIVYDFRFDGAKVTTLSINDAKGHVCRVLLRPNGFTVRKDDHDHDGPDKAVDFETKSIKLKPGEWHTLVIELRGTEMLATLDGRHTAFGAHDSLDCEKSNFGFTVAGAGASFRRARVWDALPNPDWEATKSKLLKARTVAGRSDAAAHRDDIRAAVVKALPLLEKGAAGSMKERARCFTCHNQGLPLLALTTARTRGFEIDVEHLKKQSQHIANFLEKNRDNYLMGKGTGGQVATAGQALWALETDNWKPDATTAAVAEYLLQYQKDAEHWRMTSDRPPSETSHFTANYLAIRGLRTFATTEQKERVDQRIDQARRWLLANSAKDTEDRVFRLWALKLAGVTGEPLQAATKELLDTQREDGGWSQTKDLESDSYATGSALVALHQAGGQGVDDAAYARGLKFLLRTQLEDGSWHVRSRSKPFQEYFESGFPHGPDQFISIAASSWATTALVLACEPKLEVKTAR